MSEFIKSYFSTPQKKTKMKFYSHLSKNQWQVYPLPFVYFYYETFDPESHKPLFMNKPHGFYLSFNWLKWTYVIGLYKKF